MQSVAQLYNHEVLQGHREAVAALRELLAQETDPAERRKLANALLRARPVRLVATPPAEQPKRSAQDAPATDKSQALLPTRREDRANGSESNGSRRTDSPVTSAGFAAADEGLPDSALHPDPSNNLDGDDEFLRQAGATADRIMRSNDPDTAIQKLQILMITGRDPDAPPHP